MSNRLQGKVAIVTGAGTIAEGMGNGKATALLFAREGGATRSVRWVARAAPGTLPARRCSLLRTMPATLPASSWSSTAA